jgi:uncharacterized protein (DUF2336 family)
LRGKLLLRGRLDDVMRLAKSRDTGDRERLLLELVDLCNDNTEDLNNPRVQALLSQVFFDLVFQAEHDIRLRLADKICMSDWAPAAMINILSFDDIEIARPIIAKSPILQDPDLIRILVEATLEHQVEVARRPDISALIVDAIVKGSVPEVMTALVNNPSADVTVDHLYALIQKAEKVESLRTPLAGHDGLNDELAGYLYAWVGETLRKSLGEKFKLDVQALDRALNQSVREARAGIPGGQTQTIPLGETEEERRERKLIAKLDMAGELRPGHLVKALREKRLSMFVSILATLGRFDPMDIRKTIQAGSPELLAMACAAIGLDKTAFPAILGLLRDINKGRPGGDDEAVRKATATLAQLGPGVAVSAFRKGVATL